MTAGADPNTVYVDGGYRVTLLGMATIMDRKQTCIKLLWHGASLDSIAIHMSRKLDMESQYGNRILYDIIKAVGKDRLRKEGYAPLLQLAMADKKFDYSSLLRDGNQLKPCDLKFASDHDKTLLTAAEYRQKGILEAVLHYDKLDVNTADSGARTALHLAASASHADIVNILLQQGAHCEAVDSRGQITLHRSAEHRGVSRLDRLLRHGCTLDSADNRGYDIWHCMAASNNIIALEILVYTEPLLLSTRNFQDPDLFVIALSIEDEGLAHKLLDHISNVDRKAYEVPSLSPITPIQAACCLGCSRTLLKKLLDASHSLSALDRTGSKLVHYTCERKFSGAHETLMELLDRGLDPNSCRSPDKVTGMMLAAYNGNMQVLQTLLDRGADPYSTDLHGRNALGCLRWGADPRSDGIR